MGQDFLDREYINLLYKTIATLHTVSPRSSDPSYLLDNYFLDRQYVKCVLYIMSNFFLIWSVLIHNFILKLVHFGFFFWGGGSPKSDNFEIQMFFISEGYWHRVALYISIIVLIYGYWEKTRFGFFFRKSVGMPIRFPKRDFLNGRSAYEFSRI